MLLQRIDLNQIDRPMGNDAQADTVYAHHTRNFTLSKWKS